MPAGSVNVVVTANGVQFTKTMQAGAKAAKQFGDTTEAMGRSVHKSVSSTQAASAAIRVLEGDLYNSVRAAENFVGRIPGVSSALKVAFPVIGAIALAGVIQQLAEKVTKFVQTTTQVPEKLRLAFQSSSESLRTTNDALQTSIDKVKNEIAVLENQPQNLLAISLDRSRDEADKLAESLKKASDEYRSLTKEQAIGAIAGLVTLQGSTKSTAGSIQYYKTQQANISDQLATAKDSGNTSQATSLQKQLDASRKSEEDWLTKNLASQKANNTSGSWWTRFITTQANHAPARSTQANQLLDTSALTDLHGQERQESLQGSLDKTNDQKDALEARKQSDAKRLQQMQETLAMEKAQYGLSVAQELAYWSARVSAFTKGSAQYRTVLMQQLSLQADLYKQDVETKKTYLAKESQDQKEAGSAIQDAWSVMSKVMAKQANDALQLGNAWKGYHDAVTQGAEIQTNNATSLAEATTRLQEQTGQISRHDAAIQMATAHQKEYASAMATLKDQQSQISSDTSLTPSAKAGALQQNQNSQDRLNGAYQIQAMTDRSNVSNTTLGGATSTALAQMIKSWEDMTQSITSNMERTMDGLNSDLADALVNGTSPHHRLSQAIGGTLKTGAEGLAKTGLQKAEGTVMDKLGLGGLGKMGSKGNPMWTKSADLVSGVLGGGSGTGSVSGGSSNILSALSGDAGKVGSFAKSLFSSGGKLSGITSLISKFAGFFADGGDVTQGHPAIIGERGAELFIPSSSGRIMPNGSFGNTTHNHYIDARGSTDPAGTELAVHRAMKATLHQSVSSSTHATQEMNRRRPRSAASH